MRTISRLRPRLQRPSPGFLGAGMRLERCRLRKNTRRGTATYNSISSDLPPRTMRHKSEYLHASWRESCKSCVKSLHSVHYTTRCIRGVYTSGLFLRNPREEFFSVFFFSALFLQDLAPMVSCGESLFRFLPFINFLPISCVLVVLIAFLLHVHIDIAIYVTVFHCLPRGFWFSKRSSTSVRFLRVHPNMTLVRAGDLRPAETLN